MRKFFSLLLTGILFLSVACNSGQKKAESATDEKSATEEIAADNALTTAEKEAGWILLFDGESTEGWRGVNKAVMPGAWEVIEGTLHCQGSGKGEAGATDGGDILFDKKFKNFNLKLEWKISEGLRGSQRGLFLESDPLRSDAKIRDTSGARLKFMFMFIFISLVISYLIPAR